MAQAIKTILRLSGEWPTREDLLHDGDGQPAVRVSASKPHEALPFHLDRVTDTDGHVKTRDGMTAALARIWEEWTGAKPPRYVTYEFLCGRMLMLLAKGSFSEDEEREYAARLARLEADALRQTAHGIEPCGIACPACGEGALGRPYTSEGLLDILVCDKCSEPYSMTELKALGNAHAKYGDANINVTLKEAEGILGIPLKTLHARVTRNNIKPAEWRGGRKAYAIKDIR